MSVALTFTTPPPGFAPLVDFVLDELEGTMGVFSLRAAEAETVRMFVLDASVYLPAYSPEISDEQADALGLISPDDALVLVVANPGGQGGTTTNLLAPIVVNSTTGRCTQVILDGQDWPLRAELAHA
jgi:flagellar assembly factor FliW